MTFKTLTLLLCAWLIAAAAHSGEAVDVLSAAKSDRNVLRQVVIERKYDQQIVEQAGIVIEKLKDKTWSNSSVRIYAANLLLAKAELTGVQMMDLIDEIYRLSESQNTSAVSALFRTIVFCLPPEATAQDIVAELQRRGWHYPFSTQTYGLEMIEPYVAAAKEARKQVHGRGPPAIPFAFPITNLNLSVEFW